MGYPGNPYNDPQQHSQGPPPQWGAPGDPGGQGWGQPQQNQDFSGQPTAATPQAPWEQPAAQPQEPTWGQPPASGQWDQQNPTYQNPNPQPSWPTSAMPTSGMPTSGAPASGMPAPGMPASGIPASGVPASGIPSSGAPASGVPGGWPPQPPYAGAPMGPPQKSNVGVIAAVAIGLVLVVGLVATLVIIGSGGDDEPTAAPSASTEPEESTQPGGNLDLQPTGGPDDDPPENTEPPFDPESMGSAETDNTPFTLQRFFPDESFVGSDGVTYTLTGTSFFDACTDAGNGDSTDNLMQAHGCGDMAVGVYADSTSSYFVSAMVIPFPTTADAQAVSDQLDADSHNGRTGDTFDDLAYFCPPNGYPGAEACSASNVYWWGRFGTYYRYLVVSIALYNDARSFDDSSQLDGGSAAVYDHVMNAVRYPS